MDLAGLLPNRTPLRFKVAHVLVESEEYLCLDLNLRRATKEALYQAIQETVLGMHRQDILPAAPMTYWGRYTAARVANGVLGIERVPCLGTWFSFLRVILVRA